MREILFRGKWIDNQKWEEGYYAHIRDDFKGRESHRIYSGTAESDCGDFYPDWIEVDPETVGQYTVSRDKNGKKIFDGDIVYVAGDDENAVIEWDEDTARYIIKFDGWVCDFDNFYGYDLEVIGNRWDNPELLKER